MLKFARLSQITFPNYERSPSLCLQPRNVFLISQLISPNLPDPIGPVIFRYPITARADVAVPKTPVNEDDAAETRESQVRFARQFIAMKTVAIAHAVNEPPHRHFRDSVLALYRLHGPLSDLGRFHEANPFG